MSIIIIYSNIIITFKVTKLLVNATIFNDQSMFPVPFCTSILQIFSLDGKDCDSLALWFKIFSLKLC